MKGLVLYYSATGNTKSVVDLFPEELYDIHNAKTFDISRMNNYNLIVLGMSTWEQGMPPKIFQKLAPYIIGLDNKNFMLFGSGRIEYEFYCGALDLYRDLLVKNGHKVSQILKFEGYPSDDVMKKAEKFINLANNNIE